MNGYSLMSKHYLRESSSAESENNMVPKLRIQFDSEIKSRTIKSEVANWHSSDMKSLSTCFTCHTILLIVRNIKQTF